MSQLHLAGLNYASLESVRDIVRVRASVMVSEEITDRCEQVYQWVSVKTDPLKRKFNTKSELAPLAPYTSTSIIDYLLVCGDRVDFCLKAFSEAANRRSHYF